jgi:hypothetical protein
MPHWESPIFDASSFALFATSPQNLSIYSYEKVWNDAFSRNAALKRIVPSNGLANVPSYLVFSISLVVSHH